MDEATKKLKQVDPKESEIFLYCNNQDVILNKFAQDSLKKVNLAFFELLHGIPATNEITEFKIELIPKYIEEQKLSLKTRLSKIQKDSNQALGSIELSINSKKVGMKQFVQNLILNMNMGIIDTFMDIPDDPINLIVTFKKIGNS